jgi:hypothetical protein
MHPVRAGLTKDPLRCENSRRKVKNVVQGLEWVWGKDEICLARSCAVGRSVGLPHRTWDDGKGCRSFMHELGTN